MRPLLLLAFAALAAPSLSAHGCGPRIVVRGRFWAPGPIVVLRPAPVCLRPAPVVFKLYGHGRHHGRRHQG